MAGLNSGPTSLSRGFSTAWVDQRWELWLGVPTAPKKTEYLDKSSINIDFKMVFFKPQGSPSYDTKWQGCLDWFIISQGKTVKTYPGHCMSRRYATWLLTYILYVHVCVFAFAYDNICFLYDACVFANVCLYSMYKYNYTMIWYEYSIRM